jgi:hypothetical protein
VAREFSDQFLRLARGGAVADGDQRHTMTLNHPLQGLERFFPFLLRFMGIDGGCIE